MSVPVVREEWIELPVISNQVIYQLFEFRLPKKELRKWGGGSSQTSEVITSRKTSHCLLLTRLIQVNNYVKLSYYLYARCAIQNKLFIWVFDLIPCGLFSFIWKRISTSLTTNEHGVWVWWRNNLKFEFRHAPHTRCIKAAKSTAGLIDQGLPFLRGR